MLGLVNNVNFVLLFVIFVIQYQLTEQQRLKLQCSTEEINAWANFNQI